MKNGISEIDDKHFFLSPKGKTNAKAELNATLYALLHERKLDDNATACKFPARKAWLVDKLHIKGLAHIECNAYQKVITKLNPTSATIVFPSAHINSPASMFGHTFLRINSAYNSKLLSYAINYAANVDETKTNGFMFAIHGLTGGYRGVYSMLPYYEKLKEYRDSEQRDIWEYDLDLTQDEVIKMFTHIWELNGIYSDYYFFTENCSYNLLWLLELAKKDIHLKEYFTYHVSPLETIHAMKDEGLITKEYFRDSKRTVLLKYEDAINDKYLHYVKKLILNELEAVKIIQKSISDQQKRYILEAAIELLEYTYMQGEIDKKDYLATFHKLTTARASLGIGEQISDKKPISPLDSHRQARVIFGMQYNENSQGILLGIRPVYHDLEDSNNGLLRGTQIEFLNTLLYINDKNIEIEKLTLLSIASLSQISEFIKPFSWRTHFQWDKEYLDNDLAFNISVGAGASWGNTYGYSYLMTDTFAYVNDDFIGGVGISAGLVLDKSTYFKTNIEATHRWYTNGHNQYLFKAVQSYSATPNTQFKFEYTYKDNDSYSAKQNQYRLLFNYYF